MKGRKRIKKRWQMPMYDQHVRFGTVRISPQHAAAIMEEIRNPQPLSPEVLEHVQRYNQQMIQAKELTAEQRRIMAGGDGPPEE